MANRRSDAGCPSERTEVAKARGANGVGAVKEPDRSRQGGRRGRSTDGTLCNGEKGKDPESAKGSAEKASEMTHGKQDPAWSETSPTLYGGPLTWGDDAERLLGLSNALGEMSP